MEKPNVLVDPNAIIEQGVQIGNGTSVSAFSHIFDGVVIGNDCKLHDGVYIEKDVIISNRVIIHQGVHLCVGCVLEEDVSIGPNAIFSNNLQSQKMQYSERLKKTLVRKGASIGSNATIFSGLTIGINAVIEAGAVVTRDVPSNAIVKGNPAIITGYMSMTTTIISPATVVSKQIDLLSVKQVQLITLPRIDDLRGSLTFGEFQQHLPFNPKRYFVIFEVPSIEIRGEHAHKFQHQFLVCIKGSCAIVVDDGRNRDEICLFEPNVGLYIPPMIWAIQYKFTSDAILLVLASDCYDAEDYIRNYDEFLEIVSCNQNENQKGKDD
jgi:UDP-2-acetamido-3-amino-2,3-dideoxy-glucuronate N-acetyltransferase